MKLPTDQLLTYAEIMCELHIAETGRMPDLQTATHSLGRWPDGQYFLRLQFEDGTFWELAFGPVASAMIEGVNAPKH